MRLSSKDQNIWFTADTHFHHANILNFCPNTRKGPTIEDHDRILIDNWKSQVGPEDIVFHLGDVGFGQTSHLQTIFEHLPGKINLVKGNHDSKLLNNLYLKNKFHSVQNELTIYIDGQMVVLYHYPIAEHNQTHRGSFHFYGHVHGKKLCLSGRTADVGIDSRPDGDMKLWSWAELLENMLLKPFGDH